MPRQNQSVENLLLLGKIRKRGCSSPTSSTSSILREGYRFKRAIVVGKRGGSTTPVPTWRLMGRSPSPRASGALHAAASPSSHCGSKTGKVSAPAPVSARKLAATLWEMNEMPSPRVVEEASPMIRKSRKERIAPLPPPRSSVHSGSLPPHLSDPSHSPVSEVKCFGYDWLRGRECAVIPTSCWLPCALILTDQKRERKTIIYIV